MAEMIVSSKQYADIYHSWILALYPQSDHRMMPILVNLQTGQWTDDLHSHFAQSAPWQHMLTSLKNQYSNEIFPLTANHEITRLD